MINLIPPEGHRIVRKEHFYRVGGTFAFLFGVVFIVLTTMLIPMYVLIGAQIDTFLVEIEQQGEKIGSVKKLDEEIEQANIVLSQLKNATAMIPMSEVITEVRKIASAGITFKAFIISEPDKRGVVTMQAQGNAPTRTELAQLKTTLERSRIFEKADIPISDLARERDLSFVVTITVKPSS